VIPAEVRGKVRIFKRQTAERRARLDAALADGLTGAITGFCHRVTEKGRTRALQQLRRRIDPHANFEIARLHGKPLALWASIALDEDEGAAMHFLMIGGQSAISRGIWNLRVLPHAIGRFFERGGRNLDGTLLSANHAVVKGKLYQTASGEVLVSAPPGAFIGRVDPGGFADAGVVVARTWVPADQLHPDQECRLAALDSRVAA
jgi:hypothetical protein